MESACGAIPFRMIKNLPLFGSLSPWPPAQTTVPSATHALWTGPITAPGYGERESPVMMWAGCGQGFAAFFCDAVVLEEDEVLVSVAPHPTVNITLRRPATPQIVRRDRLTFSVLATRPSSARGRRSALGLQLAPLPSGGLPAEPGEPLLELRNPHR